ncbi:hypothetical protein CC78DRAFT_535229 [Lojkania enalia]|uniref:Uncharacterized protein n=1 Tax=Lojkania enalia TaxID=147567 RepID=A0A9P4K6R3_9PLEO|nr:hypothetical protein CC78DRAFT_535229 [Didymosphaeria enalia]
MVRFKKAITSPAGPANTVFTTQPLVAAHIADATHVQRTPLLRSQSSLPPQLMTGTRATSSSKTSSLQRNTFTMPSCHMSTHTATVSPKTKALEIKNQKGKQRPKSKTKNEPSGSIIQSVSSNSKTPVRRARPGMKTSSKTAPRGIPTMKDGKPYEDTTDSDVPLIPLKRKKTLSKSPNTIEGISDPARDKLDMKNDMVEQLKLRGYTLIHELGEVKDWLEEKGIYEGKGIDGCPIKLS